MRRGSLSHFDSQRKPFLRRAVAACPSTALAMTFIDSRTGQFYPCSQRQVAAATDS